MQDVRKRSKRILIAGSALVMVASTALVAGASTNPSRSVAATPAPGASLVQSGPQKATKTWTSTAMSAAKPMPMPVPPAGTPNPAPNLPTGAPGVEPGSSPDPSEPGAAPQSVSVTPTAGGFTYPTPFDRYNVFPNYKIYPYKTVGKLFFTQGAGSFVCSASSIGNDAIWTAGHCVSDGAGNFSTNLVFVPAYKSGAAPYGTFSCPNIITFTAWHTGGNLARDSGGASCGLSSLGNGKKVSQAVGSLGFAWNQPSSTKHYNVLGYPQAAPFNGALQVQCSSSFGHLDTLQSFSPSTFAVGCDSTGGVSGGPYVINFSGTAGASNYLNGNASYRYLSPSQPLELYTPFLDDSSKTLKDALVA